MNIKMLSFVSNGDDRGQLIALEEFKNIPFDIKRVYYMYTVPGVTRGKHAHRHLEQVLICVHGSCKIRLNDGTEEEVVTLDDPAKGLYVANDMWREMFDFSEGAVLMVVASELYDETDYIRDYDEFLEYVHGTN